MRLLKHGLFAILLLGLLAGWVNTAYAYDEFEEYYYRARVIEVEEHDDDDGGLMQNVTVRLTSGPFKGEIVTFPNYYMPENLYFDLRVAAGNEVIMVAFEEGDTLGDVYLQDMARERGVYYLGGLFVVLLLLVGRWKGLKTLVALGTTIFLIATFLLPNLLRGYSPILLAVITAVIVVVFTLVIIAGLSYKTLAAILGTISGFLVAGLLALWVGHLSHLTGLSSQEAQLLFYLSDTVLDIRGILFAGIIIGSLGAVTDIGISVSSAAAEIKRANPEIKVRELTMSAMNVGRDVLGTMSNTLILAYVGAATPLLLLVTGHHNSFLKIINLDLIATELVRGMAGSIGLVVAVPVTAILSGYFMGKQQRKAA